MILIMKRFNVFITLIMCLMLLFSLSGCDKSESIKDYLPDTVRLKSDVSDHYIITGNEIYLSVHCEPEKNRPAKPVYVWQIRFNGNLLEEIVHDSEPKDERKVTDSDYYEYVEGETEYEWPNYDELLYQYTNKGTYTITTDLYDYNEYSRDKSKAIIQSSYTHTVYCDEVKMSIEATPTKNSREYTLKVTADKPKFLPFGCPTKWEFIDESTGSADSGRTEEISAQYALFKDGTQEVEHQFQKSGRHKVIFTVLGYLTAPVAKVETIVDISRTFQIIVPLGPLKTGEEYTFTARTDSPEELKEIPSYEWDFGDDQGLIIQFSNEATHVFENPGKYVIHVEVFESQEEAAPIIGSAYVQIEVEASANHLMELHKMNKFALDFSVQHDYIEGTSGIYSWDMDSYGEVVWNGVNFSMEWSQYNHSERMTGQVSEDGTIIKQLKIRHEFVDSKGITEWFELEIVDLPFWDDPMPDRFIVDKSGLDIQEFVPYFNTYRTAGYQWTDDSRSRLYIRFEK